jgi:hypothetical protein
VAEIVWVLPSVTARSDLAFLGERQAGRGLQLAGLWNSAAIVNLFMSVISRLISFQNLSFTHSPVV